MDMLYPIISVPGRVNGGFHEMFTVDELIKERDNPATIDKGPVDINQLQSPHVSPVHLYM